MLGKITFFCCFLSLMACVNTNRPLDADERHQVDSLAAAAIGVARRDLDSICRDQRKNYLPLLIDSLKKERLRNIQEQIKQIPK